MNVTDAGVPSASSLVVSNIHIVFVNDHAPTLTIHVSGDCASDTGNLPDRVRREVADAEASDFSKESSDQKWTLQVTCNCVDFCVVNVGPSLCV